ncbi:MAG: N-acetyltransferase [Devosiaceae bacterium]|nr:N-acetyltransferase [Devosiaceae bacterium MH13]
MTITHSEEGSKGAYTATMDGKPPAEMTYSRASPTLIIIDHTGVPDELRGTGVGKMLVERAVLDARASGTKIMPLCPFAKAQIAKTPDWHDVLS